VSFIILFHIFYILKYRCKDTKYSEKSKAKNTLNLEKSKASWVWDGNTPLHEWTYDEKDRPKTVIDEYGLKHTEGVEPIENITTWIFEEGSFRPAAKLTKDRKYAIVTDCPGTPAQMYDEKGQLVWQPSFLRFPDIFHIFVVRTLTYNTIYEIIICKPFKELISHEKTIFSYWGEGSDNCIADGYRMAFPVRRNCEDSLGFLVVSILFSEYDGGVLFFLSCPCLFFFYRTGGLVEYHRACPDWPGSVCGMLRQAVGCNGGIPVAVVLFCVSPVWHFASQFIR
jgi:hypothetical protein